MKTRLLLRIEALERRAPESSVVKKTIVPEWLLAEWQKHGLQFDPADDESVRRALRMEPSTGVCGECRA